MSALLSLLWFASPALPVGGFSYSEGLEASVEAGLVTNEAEATRWIVDQLHLTLARSELPALAEGLLAWRRDDRKAVRALNDWVLATRESHELRAQTEQMGRSLADWLRQRAADAQAATLAALPPAPSWPVAAALALARSEATPADALAAFAFGWGENMVQAAVKAVPLGQSAGQRILAALVGEIPTAVAEALALPPADRQAFSPRLAVLSAQHEVQYSRLFRS